MARPLHAWFSVCAILFSGFYLQGQTFNGEGNLLIPPGAPSQTEGITTSIATVSGVGILGTGCSYIDHVTINLTHTWDGDLGIFLIAPSGEVLDLSSGNGVSGDNYQITTFQDDTPLFITAGSPPYNGVFRPEGRHNSTSEPFQNSNPLGTYTFENTFNGINADGDWTLMINDFLGIDVGVLHAWSITFSIGNGPAPTVTLGPDLTICPGETTTLTATVTPSATDYLWNTGATTTSINVTPSVDTYYSVTVTNNGCIDVDSILVEVNPGGVSANAGADIGTCQGTPVTLTGSGGGPGASYAWSTGQSGSSISVNPASTTTYTLTVTEGQCSGTDQVTVTVNALPIAEAGQPVTICFGQSTTLIASGGFQNNHYLWNTGQNGASINVTPATTTTYSVTVTVNGCSDTDDVQVVVNQPPTLNAGPDVQICAGEPTTLSATGTGTSYLWSTGQSGSDITVTPVGTTTFTVTATNNGCSATDNVTVTVGNIIAGITPDQSICEGTTILLTATGGTTYSWSTGESEATISVAPATTTTYTVTATQGNCSDEATVNITVNPIPIVTISPDETICAGEFINLTASGGAQYLWSSGQNTSSINVNPAVTTTYTVTVSDNGCSSSASVIVDVNPTPNTFAGFDQQICEGQSATLMASGLSGNGAYIWSTGETVPEITVDPTMTTTYSVTVTNEWDCFATDAVIVFVNLYPDADAGQDQELCDGNSATIVATGGTNPSSYQWSTGQSGASITVSPSINTAYTVTVTIGGCSSSDEIEVEVLDPPVANAGDDEQICVGELVELTASGGGTYLWSNGMTSATINVSPGVTTTYTVEITANNGCIDEDNVTISVFPNPQADAGPDQAICEGETTSLNGNGGGEYSWSSGENIQDINISPIGTTSYGLTVTDMNGCTDSDVVTVTVNSIPFANAGSNVFILSGEQATLTATGGGSYLWSTGETTSQIVVAPSATTTYSVTVTVNGCNDNDQVIVFVNEAPSIDLGPDLVICEGETTTIDGSIAGPFDLEYLWNTGETTSTIQVSPSNTTSYSVTATDMISGLSSSDTLMVTVLSLPIGIPVISGETTLCQGQQETYTVDPVSGASMYSWSVPAGATLISGQGSTSIDVDWGSSPGGQIQLLVSNSCGSLPSSILDVMINIPPILSGPIEGPIDPCADVSASYTIENATNAISYQWSISQGGSITAGQGASTIMVDWNGSMGGDICVLAENSCGNSQQICLSVVTTAIPLLDAGLDESVCGLGASMNGSGVGTWSFTSGPGTLQINNPIDPATTIQSSTPGVYTLEYAIAQNGCVAKDSVQIEFLDIPSITNTITDCNSTNTSYTFSFDVVGGLLPYTINGNFFGGGTYTSSPINSGEAYTFQIVDANGCNSVTFEGEVLCSCSTEIGAMDPAPINVCISAIAIATYQGGEVLDGNDTMAFVLHNGNIPGGIIAWNSSPQFPFAPPLQPGTIYFISAIIGDTGVDGLPLLSDPCLAISEGTPVIFHDNPDVSFPGDTTICAGTCASIKIKSEGTNDFEVTYEVANEVLTEQGSNGIIEITVCPDSTSVYRIISVKDQYCQVALDEELEVIVRENAFAGIPSDRSVCVGDAIQIDLTSLLLNSDPAGIWTETSVVPSIAGAFNQANATFNTSSQASGIYSFNYEIGPLDGCPGSSAVVNITIDDLPVANAGDDQVLDCVTDNTILDGSESSSGSDYEYLWTSVGGSIVGPVDSLLTSVAGGGIYVFQVANSIAGCKATDTIIVKSHTLTWDSIQIHAEALACADGCNGSIVILHAIDGLLIDFGDGNFAEETTLQNVCSGIYPISIMDELGCVLDTTVEIEAPLPLEVDLGPDLVIAFGDSVTLTAQLTFDPVLFNWFDASSCATCASITVAPAVSTVYTVEVLDDNQCAATDEIQIIVEIANEIFIPNIFSPDGDQVNERFVIAGSAGLSEIRSIEIFDRWGNKIFEQKNVIPGDSERSWDGMFKGSPVSPGVYVFKIEALFADNPNLVVLGGDITVIR